MRKQFFRKIDSLLPRWVARLPYDFALWTMKAVLGMGLKTKVWNRNSTRSGSFIMGVSDLDITILSRSSVPFEFLNYSLAVFKKIFIFLGETNLYHEKQLEMVLPRMNAFEMKRDPVLKGMAAHPVEESAVEKFVFTQRMLFADIFTLKEDPTMRQSKWRNHFELIGYPHQGKLIDLTFVVNSLKELSSYDPLISQGLESWLKEIGKPGFNIYETDLTSGFKIMAPHCYLWFHHQDESSFLEGLNDFQKAIIKRQIDWEFWGLYAQRFHLNRNSIVEHMGRLKQAYKFVSSAEEYERLERDIALAF